MPRRTLLVCLVAFLLAGCADAMQRYRTVGLTENQRTDLVLFETVVQFVRDSFGGPLSIDGRLSNSARWPTVGLEPDSSRADATVATAARRAVMRRHRIPETFNATGRGCVTESAWDQVTREQDTTCPATQEVRVGIGPFYAYVADSAAPAEPNVYRVNVVRTDLGPRGLMLRDYYFLMRQRDGKWVVAEMVLKETIG